MNQNLLKYREVSTSNLNNLCTIMHKMAAEGSYTGQVFSDGGTLLGTFSLVYDKKNAATQAQVDLSTFDTLTQVNLNKPAFQSPPAFVTGQDGIVIFFISGAHSGLYATLAGSDNKQVFDSRKLDKGDAAVFRLISQGNYTVTDTAGQVLNVTVNAPPVNGKYPALADQQPVMITLDATGFTPGAAAIDPLQVIVVAIGVPTSLDLTT